MLLYSAGQIVKRLNGVTTRQILDLAEKGLITPARETTGAGSPRLYDFQNIFEICVCLAVRGRIPAGTATQELIAGILHCIRESTEEAKKEKENTAEGQANKIVNEQFAKAGFPRPEPIEPPAVDLYLIAYDDKNNYSFLEISHTDTFGEALSRSKKYRPQNYCTYILEVSAIWEYLKKVF
jgi:hypothetical protein